MLLGTAYLKPIFQVLRGIVSFPVSLVFSEESNIFETTDAVSNCHSI